MNRSEKVLCEGLECFVDFEECKGCDFFTDHVADKYINWEYIHCDFSEKMGEQLEKSRRYALFNERLGKFDLAAVPTKEFGNGNGHGHNGHNGSK